MTSPITHHIARFRERMNHVHNKGVCKCCDNMMAMIELAKTEAYREGARDHWNALPKDKQDPLNEHTFLSAQSRAGMNTAIEAFEVAHQAFMDTISKSVSKG